MNTNDATMTREDRDELAAAAAAADRRNTPTSTILIGTIVLLLGIVVLLVAFVSLGAARVSWELKANELRNVRAMVAEFQAIDEASADPNKLAAHEPRTNMNSELQRFAREAGVDAITLPRNDFKPSNTSGTRIATFSFENLRDDSLEEFMSWIDTVLDQIPGMRVDSLELPLTANSASQQTPQWQLSVTFARTEFVN